jgi:hypothetical protein
MVAPHIRTIAHTFQFPWQDRGLLQFSDADKVHLYRRDGLTVPDLRLRLQPSTALFGAQYPTDDDLYVRTQPIEPSALRAWVALFVVTDQPDDTLIQYRLHDTGAVQDLYWDGGAWSAAGASDWNTLQEVQDNLASLDATTVRGLRLVFNLHTDDANVTPRVTEAIVLFTAAIPSFTEDVIYRTFLRQMGAGVQPLADVVVQWPGGTTYTHDHDAMEEPPGVATRDVVAAYDLDSDPDRETDLLQSYNTGTGVVTLSQSVTADNNVLLQVEFEPLVAVLTHPDFDELSAVPAVTVTGIDEDLVGETPIISAAINVGDNTAKAVPAPRQVNFTLELTVVVPRGLDLVRVVEAVQTWIRNNPVLSSDATGANLTVTILEPFSSSPRGDAAHLHEGILTVRLWNANQWIFPAVDTYGVENLVITWNP